MPQVPKSRRWTLAASQRSAKSVRRILAKREARANRTEALRFAATQVLLLEGEKAELQQLVRFHFALEALRLHAQTGGLDHRHVTQIAMHARTMLAQHGIAAERSKLGHLNAEVETYVAHILARDGRHWEAATQQCLAISTLQRSESPLLGRHMIELGHRWLRLGDALPAIEAFARAELDGLAPDELPACRLAAARALRLAGRREEAAAALDAVGAAPSETAWEALVLSCRASGDFSALARITARNATHYDPGSICRASLYIAAHERRVDRNLVPRLETVIRRRDLSWSFQDPLLELARRLDRGEVESLGAALSNIGSVADVEDELLAWAAAARAFARAHDFRMASTTLRRYRALSLALTETREEDTLGVADTLLARPWLARPLAANRPHATGESA